MAHNPNRYMHEHGLSQHEYIQRSSAAQALMQEVLVPSPDKSGWKRPTLEQAFSLAASGIVPQRQGDRRIDLKAEDEQEPEHDDTEAEETADDRIPD
jgi:hypothetical protein